MAAIVFYPQTGGSHSSPEYGDPVPVVNHFALAEHCEQNGLDTDWWLPVANRIILRAGEESSEAYLVLEEKWINGATVEENVATGGPKRTIEEISRSLYNHKIALLDNYTGDNPVVQQGWVFHSAQAIDPDNISSSVSPAYLVKFVDLRHLWSTQGSIHHDWLPDNVGYNVTDTRRSGESVGSIELDPENCSDWPYLEWTVKNAASGLPFYWDELLSFFWYAESPFNITSDTSLWDGGATLFFQDTPLPEGGVYPFQFPLDIRPNFEKTWAFFCKLLHCTGNEIFPEADGTWRIESIDANFGNLTLAEDPEISKFLINETFSEDSTNRLPFAMTMTFQTRVFSPAYYPIACEYITAGPYNTVEGGSGGDIYPYEALMTEADFNASGCTLARSGDAGEIENVLSIGMTAFLGTGDFLGRYTDDEGLAAANEEQLRGFAIDVLSKLALSRAEPSVNATYGLFMGVVPNPSFEEVHYYISPSGPCTYLRSVEASVGVNSIPPSPHIRDRLVAADNYDDVPGYLTDKIEDHLITGYDSLAHQVVWAEAVQHEDTGTGISDNKVRLYTTISAGAPGPTGPTGPAGPAGPTYTDGCGILISGTVVSFDPTDALGVGMQLSPDPFDPSCAISPDPADLAGCGLEDASDNAATDRVKLKVDPDALWELGGGLESGTDNDDIADGPCKLKIAPGDLVTSGGGLMAATGNTTLGAGPVKLKIRPSDLCGTGLTPDGGNQDDPNGPVKIKVDLSVSPVIRNITGLTLVLAGGVLRVNLDYTEYQVYGVATGNSGTLTSYVATTTCP